MSSEYSNAFFSNRRELALASAKQIFDVLWQYTQPESVLDVGCATGIWLAECQRRGVSSIYGIDGPWVPVEELEIPQESFHVHDLSVSIPQTIEKKELALCIELAEHLDKERAQSLIKFLTEQADVVLFSAAIPGQGGTGHVNENTQSYWHSFFSEQGFDCFDIVRPKLWDSADVNVIYKQNMLLYVNRDSEALKSMLESDLLDFTVSSPYELNRVHPDLFLKRATRKVKLSKSKRLKKKIKGFLGAS